MMEYAQMPSDLSALLDRVSKPYSSPLGERIRLEVLCPNALPCSP
jgi:hypothetical protein